MSDEEAHKTMIWRNAVGTAFANPFVYGWSCACGASGAGWASRAEARNEADEHHEWAFTNGLEP